MLGGGIWLPRSSTSRHGATLMLRGFSAGTDFACSRWAIANHPADGRCAPSRDERILARDGILARHPSDLSQSSGSPDDLQTLITLERFVRRHDWNVDLYDALLPVGAHVPYFVEVARQQPGAVLGSPARRRPRPRPRRPRDRARPRPTCWSPAPPTIAIGPRGKTAAAGRRRSADPASHRAL